MEAFTVLLFTFFSQLRVSVNKEASVTRVPVTGRDKASSHQKEAKDYMSWLTMDVDWQSMGHFFPQDLLNCVLPRLIMDYHIGYLIYNTKITCVDKQIRMLSSALE